MRLSETLVAKFQQAFLEKFGIAISVEVAESELLELAELVKITGQTDKDVNDGDEYGQPKLG